MCSTENSYNKFLTNKFLHLKFPTNSIFLILNLKFSFLDIYCAGKKLIFTTQVTAFLCPTKSLSCFHPSLSIIWAVGPPPFIACADTRYCPSGDQESLKTCVVAEHSEKQSVTTSCWVQSAVLQTLKVLSSDWLAMYFPTGSHVTPF